MTPIRPTTNRRRAAAGRRRPSSLLAPACLALASSSLPGIRPFSAPLSPSTHRRRLGLGAPHYCRSSVARTSRSPTETELRAVSSSRVAILDGAEFLNVEAYLSGTPPLERRRYDDGSVGCMTLAVGTVEGGGAGEERRVVGVVAPPEEGGGVPLGPGAILYPQSAAPVPDSVSDDDALTTAAAALSGVHCALPVVENVGGSGVGGKDEVAQVSGRVVVLGGGEMAAFAADGLAAMGADVTIVSANKPKNKNKSVAVLPPAVGDEEVGFASVLGDFDGLVDTLEDESGAVLTQLSKQNKCDRYVSTLTRSQKLVRDDGVLFGPGKAKMYAQEIARGAPKQPIIRPDEGSSKSKYRPIVPPANFGPGTVSTLLEKGVLFKPSGGSGKSGDPFVRGWTLSDFWEFASWPRDSTGDGDVRYGLPVRSEAEVEAEEEAARELVLPRNAIKRATTRRARGETSPHVLEIDNIGALREHITSTKRDAVLFLSAPWCRTCRSLKPGYNRMARAEAEQREEEAKRGAEDEARRHRAVTFAKCEAVGEQGKGLSHYLDVDAVPAFVVFRRGEVLGEPLSVSRLPSPELDRALERIRAD